MNYSHRFMQQLKQVMMSVSQSCWMRARILRREMAKAVSRTTFVHRTKAERHFDIGAARTKTLGIGMPRTSLKVLHTKATSVRKTKRKRRKNARKKNRRLTRQKLPKK